MIENIAQIADVHIRKIPTRNDEYDGVFDNLIKSLTAEKPDRIVIVGDLVHDNLDLQGEQLIMASKLLNDLSKIAPVRITRGNHDYRKKASNRVDSVKAIVDTLNNPNVVYYDKTDVFYDENVAWMVWHHGEDKNNPWKTKEGKIYEKLRETSSQYTAIDLFHDQINGSKMPSGIEVKSKAFYKSTDFKGDMSMFGDIHKQQYLDKAKTKAYSSSLIAQRFDEGDDNFHGYLLWNVSTKKAKEISVENDYSLKNVKITTYTDFDDLDFDIPDPTKYMKIRIIWNTLPSSRCRNNERRLAEYIKSKYQNTTISHKNEFIETDKIDVNENVTLDNVANQTVQHEIFKEYLIKIGIDEKVIDDVIALDEEILKEIDTADDTSVEWNVVKFGGKNFMSYEQLDIDWRDMDGLFQITGVNTAGKTTIMKLMTYVLFGKTLETENRVKYGDARFVNNRNDAKSCEGYIIIEANGEYFGIKKKTEINRAKDGSINGAPTSIGYYLLTSPDDEMNDDTSIDKLTDDNRIKTQKRIESIIGTYDNFMRIVMTTSDTLNKILSNDMAVFIDSILFDSGLDIFDKKLEGYKAYQKKLMGKSRVTCRVENVTNQNVEMRSEIIKLNSEVVEIETVKIIDIQTKIATGRTYVEGLNKKLYTIDPEIYNLSVDDIKEDISTHEETIVDLKARNDVLLKSILPLKKEYDEKRLTVLIDQKELNKQNEYKYKLDIKSHEQIIHNEEHEIEIINGDIFRLKNAGLACKNKIFELKNSKTCPTCGQLLSADHQVHINAEIETIENEMFDIGDKINDKETVDKLVHDTSISNEIATIDAIRLQIEKDSLAMEDILREIGELTNEKNDVEKRKELQNELDQIPLKISNEELIIGSLQTKINNYDNSIKLIEENKAIEIGIKAAKLRLEQLETEDSELKEDVYLRKTDIGGKQIKIKENEELLAEFEIQEYRDKVMELYKKCVHRDGIPRQMLSNYILPKINFTLERVLSSAPFKVWLDADDLRPKLVYNNRPTAIIDCISASGKERTFASVVLKFSLNQINIKAKPTIFLLDEVMGKLSDDSIEEFVEILQIIKANMKKVLIVEQMHEVSPDYLLNVTLNDDGISSVILE